MIVRLTIYNFLLLLPFFSFAQVNMDKEISILESLTNARKYEQAYKLVGDFQEKCGDNCPKVFLTKKGFVEARHLMDLGFLDSAIQIVNPWLPQLDLTNLQDKSTYCSFTTLKGQCLRRLGKLDEASEAFLEVLKIGHNHEFSDSVMLFTTLVNLSSIDIFQQKFHKARIQLTQALDYGVQLNGRNSISVAYCLNNLSLIANALGEPEKAIAYLKESIAIKEGFSGGSQTSLAMSNLNLGSMLGEHDRFREAIPYFNHAIEILSKASRNGNWDTPIAEVLLGNIYADLGQADSALIFLKLAEAAVIKVDSTNPFRATHLLQHLGEGYLRLEDVPKARYFLDQAIHRLGVNLDDKIDFSTVSDHRYLHQNFQRRIEIYQLALAEGAEIYADSVEMILEQNLALYRYLQQHGGESRDRQIITELSLPLFEGYLDYLSGQAHPSMEKVFELMEMGKARLLSEKLQQAEIPYFAGISDSISNRENQLDSSIFSLEQQLNRMRPNGENESLISLEQEINQLKRERETFLSHLKRDHPAYYSIKYVQTPIPLAQAQLNLEEDEALVSYFVGKSNIYILVLQQDSAQLTKVDGDFPLRQWVAEFREAMYKHGEMASPNEQISLAHAEAYCQTAYNLYDKLLSPIAGKLPLKVRIIPDGVLSFLPFDALISQLPDHPENFRDHSYLIHKFQFSYSISATLHHQQLQTPTVPAPKLALAMAPSFAAPSKFQNLLHNSPEVEKIQAVIGGETLQGQKATAQAFREKAADFRILHIASHAKSDDQNGDNSYIAFATTDSSSQNQDLIYSRDIYGIPLQAEMVVLSACETGLGEWQAGEGIIGLTRACMYAGAKSTVTSLWQVDDSRTSTLIEKFYDGLGDGLSKDAALRQAKLHYLRTETSPHPYYWAAFIPIGNMAPISLGPDYRGVWTGVSILLGLLILTLVWRKIKKNKRARL